MAERRQYESPLRRQQAAVTRRQILQAAQRLFERKGYATTTVAQIAAEAGVSQKTVYLAFETKSGVLRALWNTLLRGEPDDTPTPARRWYEDALEEPDPAERLRMAAHNSRVVKAIAGRVLWVIRTAAPSDPDIAALWQRIETEFRGVLRPIVEAIAADGALRRDLDVDEATDILWTLVHPDIWRLLVDVRGWKPARYERWCAQTACEQLLAP
jgi:AcrR family transcriptional regulator